MKYLKIIAGVIVTIFLGAIGSGVWEKFLSPFLESISRKSIELVSSIYTGYLDSIYKSSAYDVPNVYQQKVAALLLIIVGVYWVVAMLREYNLWKILSHRLEENTAPITSKMYRKFFRLYFLGLGLLLLTLGMFLISKADYIQKTIKYSYQSMDILHPYIGNQKYLYLKSEYHQVTTAEDFLRFNEKIISYAKLNGAKLPEFDAIE